MSKFLVFKVKQIEYVCGEPFSAAPIEDETIFEANSMAAIANLFKIPALRVQENINGGCLLYVKKKKMFIDVRFSDAWERYQEWIASAPKSDVMA